MVVQSCGVAELGVCWVLGCGFRANVVFFGGVLGS